MKNAAPFVPALLLVTCGCLFGEVGSSDSGDSVPVEDRPEFSRTESGLQYRVLREGNGTHPTPNSTVTVHYKGWLDDGSVFDSSYQRGRPATFPLSRVVKGWTEGMQLVSETGQIELVVPPELGYGPGGMPGAIPPNATLHFEIELIEVRP